jgi:hypothetical protein
MNDIDLPARESAFERKLTSYAKVGIPVATFLGMIVAGVISGPPLAVLVLASGALIGVITALWASLRALLGETPLTGADAYALAAPRAEEEQKRAVLRALKDLEFERSVGKIDEHDYRELVEHYRTEAKRLLRMLDDEAVPRRAQAEELLAKRLRAEAGGDDDDAEPIQDVIGEELARRERKANKKKRKKERARLEAETSAKSPVDPTAEVDDDGRTCVACGTTNDLDAVFCKKCGAKQERE